MKNLAKWIPSYMVAAATLIMVCANVLGGANIPWIVVLLPTLIQLTLCLLAFAMFGAVALMLKKLLRKAEK